LENLKYSEISDEELAQTVQKIINQFPNSGIRMKKGHLTSRGI